MENLPDHLIQGLDEIAAIAERRGYEKGYRQAIGFLGRVGPREVFLIPAHSTLGEWRVEPCTWGDSVRGLLEKDYDRVLFEQTIFKTREEALAAIEAGGYTLSALEPHAEGMRRQYIRPPYSW